MSRVFASPSKQGSKQAPISPAKAPEAARFRHGLAATQGAFAAVSEITAGPRIQGKLRIGAADDRYEREADRVADQVMRMPVPASTGEPRVQPKCSCGGECSECRQRGERRHQEERLVQPKRIADNQQRNRAAPAIVGEALRQPGQPLEPATRGFMETRFGRDFGPVRVHVGVLAAESANAIQALAYTSGRDIVFGPGKYAPRTGTGRQLLAHELVHVIQQTGRSPSGRPASGGSDHALRGAEHAPIRHRSPGLRVSRQNNQQTASVLSQGAVAGVQFVLDGTVNSTRVGPVSGRKDVSVVVGRLTNIRDLAQVLLPLWNSATPFTPPGGGAPLAINQLTVDELAQGLLVFNRYRLAIPPAANPPVMTNWNIGMRFPLPIRIDSTTDEGVLHHETMRRLSGAFNATWAGLLDALPAVLPGQSAGDLQQAVATFLTSTPSTEARGIHLGVRATANAEASQEFVLEVFNQVGAGAFDLALAFMDWRVNRDISVLAAQTAGAAILNRIRALVAAPPAALSSAQQASLARTNTMLGLVAAVQPLPKPCVPNRDLTWANFTGAVPGGAAARIAAATHFRIDSVAFQGNSLFQATLNQGASWARPQYLRPGNMAANGCQPYIAACETYFTNGNPGPWGHPGGVAGCAAGIGPAATTSNNLGECATVLGAACTAAARLESVRLLRHEQLHFDIPCILVGKANATRAAGTALGLGTVRARANTLTSRYDNQTDHGCSAGTQAQWEADIAAGLPAQTFP